MASLYYYVNSINWKLRVGEPIYFILFMNYVDKKKYDSKFQILIDEFKGNRISEENFIKKYALLRLKSMKETLELIWKLLKEKKVKVEKFEIEEYDKPKEIEKVMFNWKFRKKYITSWIWKKVWELDPCEYKDNEELEKEIKKWKKDTIKLYKYVSEKYGKNEANFLLDILEIVRSDCYDWEIEIE